MDMKKIVGGAPGAQNASCLLEVDAGCVREVDAQSGAQLNCLRETDGKECANEDYQFA